jgi:hypothetical protein
MAHNPLATHRHENGQLDHTLAFLKRIRSELRETRRVQVADAWLRIFDVNGDCFEVTGIGYGDADIVPVLNALNTVYRPDSIHQPIDRPYKEFKTGKRRPWAEDRVM